MASEDRTSATRASKHLTTSRITGLEPATSSSGARRTEAKCPLGSACAACRLVAVRSGRRSAVGMAVVDHPTVSAVTVAAVDAYRLAISAVSEPGFTVFLEPEGMTYEVAPGRGLTLGFGPSAEPPQVSWTASGLVVGRPLDLVEAPTVTADDGTPVEW